MFVLNIGTSALETKTSEQTTVSTLPAETTEGKGTLLMPSAFFEYMQG